MTMNNHADQSRRKFLGTSAAAVAGITIVPGVLLHTPAQARPVDQPASSKQRWGILIDTNQCAEGCNDCVTACQTENAWGKNEVKSAPGQQAQWIRKVNLKDPNTGHQQSLPVMCQHCETPPCVDVCPTGASMKRADGIVLVDKHICIGCRYCMMACPYKARSFVHEELHGQVSNAPRGKGTVESCTMCVDRVDAGGTPACVEACSKAMVFGDLMDPNSEISKRLKQYGGKQIRADLGLNPGVRYQGL
jgi:tetrathionate reductase subunit B